jgi:protein-L-isoaspartate(D-aspartate) O-methyltransferase
MVERLQAQGHLRDARVAEAMRRVPRHLFLPGRGGEAYADRPLGIGAGQTISAPHMVAIMAEALEARPGMKVLEVGAGSGYHAAVVAELLHPGGRVVSVERFEDLAARARQNLAHAGYGPDRVEVVVGDGSDGWPPGAPYDRIYLTCAAPRVPPPLLEQAKERARVLAPVGDRSQQTLVLVERTPQGIVEHDLGGCVFVPLIGKHGFPETRWN